MATSESVPEPLVLVLNVLSETHARPVTGMVVSANGQVLVPATFVGRGDEIVLLEGGTRMESDTLATRTDARDTESGLAILAADGLNRTPFRLADGVPSEGERLLFAAFPPAEQLASGLPPLAEQVSVSIASGTPRVSAATPLPNVTGALIDRCGRLAGVVVSVGTASLDRSVEPAVTWAPQLGQSLRALGVEMRTGHCNGEAGDAAPSRPPSSQAEKPGPLILDQVTLAPRSPDLDVSRARAIPADGADPAAAGDHGSPLSPTAPAAQAAHPDAPFSPPQTPPAGPRDGMQDPAEPVAVDHLTATLLIAGLFGAIGLGWWLGRRGVAGPPLPVTEIPAERSRAQPAKPAAEPNGDPFLMLEFRLTLPGGPESSRSVRLHRQHGTLLVGRGPVDISLPVASLDSVHGRIQVIDGLLVYSDAGGKSGSWVDGVECLEGEVFALAEGARLDLGPVTLRLVSARPSEAASA